MKFIALLVAAASVVLAEDPSPSPQIPVVGRWCNYGTKGTGVCENLWNANTYCCVGAPNPAFPVWRLTLTPGLNPHGEAESLARPNITPGMRELRFMINDLTLLAPGDRKPSATGFLGLD
ncbi:hypothetical protein E4U41_006795 [Claviceps citrina]|nr:hypothetical protein E4U41_006795 [Claviceps citrina]